jgi:hypothetical protein
VARLGVEGRLEAILDEFPLDVSSTRVLDVPGLDRTSLYEVDLGSGLIPRDVGLDACYILDSEAGMTVACHPHLVGVELAELCLGCAGDFWASLMALGLLSGGFYILNILRGSSGYRVSEAFPPGTPVVSVRTEYSEEGYRAHSDDYRTVRVTYSDLDPRRLAGLSTLIVPDTFATGRSAEAALVHIFDNGAVPDRAVLYGFTAIPALERLGLVCAGWGVDLVSFSICDVTQLASNHYDMPVYGLDESLWESRRELRRLGSVVDVETLKRMMPRYVAGLDQPGDWSERHLDLFDGAGAVSGDVAGHLRKSVGLVESLVGLNSRQPWYDGWHGGIAEAELGLLREALRGFS